MAAFEERLAALGKGNAVSQAEPGEMLGVARWPVLNYEAGKKRPDYKGLIALAGYFAIPPDYLTGRTDQR